MKYILTSLMYEILATIKSSQKSKGRRFEKQNGFVFSLFAPDSI